MDKWISGVFGNPSIHSSNNPLEHFQNMCSRRRQSALIELREITWRELTFAATNLFKPLKLIHPGFTGSISPGCVKIDFSCKKTSPAVTISIEYGLI